MWIISGLNLIIDGKALKTNKMFPNNFPIIIIPVLIMFILYLFGKLFSQYLIYFTFTLSSRGRVIGP